MADAHRTDAMEFGATAQSNSETHAGTITHAHADSATRDPRQLRRFPAISLGRGRVGELFPWPPWGADMRRRHDTEIH